MSELEQRLAMLDRLEQLEQQQEAAARNAAGGGAGGSEVGRQDEIVVTTQKASVGLVKGVHLPDAILLPGHESD